MRRLLTCIVIVLVVLLTVHEANASMSFAEIEYSGLTVTGTADLIALYPAILSTSLVNVNDSTESSFGDATYNDPSSSSSATGNIGSALGDVVVDSGDFAVSAFTLPPASVDSHAEAAGAQDFAFMAQQDGTITASLDYSYRYGVTTASSGDWASMDVFMIFKLFEIVDEYGTENDLAHRTIIEGWNASDGTVVAENLITDTWTFTVDLAAGQSVHLYLNGTATAGAYTAETEVVPVPAASLLGVLGLGVAGHRLRRRC